MLDLALNGVHAFGALLQFLGTSMDLVKASGEDLAAFVPFKLLLGDTRVLEHNQGMLDLFLLVCAQLFVRHIKFNFLRVQIMLSAFYMFV